MRAIHLALSFLPISKIGCLFTKHSHGLSTNSWSPRSGLDMINISLDTLRPERFEQMTRRKGWKLVYEGLVRASEVGFEKVKLNCVVIRGFNDDELVDFVRLATNMPIEVRFIEFMPFFGNRWSKNSLVPFKTMLQTIQNEYPDLAEVKHGPNDTSRVFRQSNMLGSIGFISSLTENFCHSCNRLRLTSDGNLKVCLFDKRETSLRDLLRNGATDSEIVRAIQTDLLKKKKQHAGELRALVMA
jgi:molybdenum cofactor biosynthesis enzyme MoaA